MNIRTTEDLVDAFAREINWRRVELSELKRLVEVSTDNEVRKAALTRSAIALLYAHWEGLVKRLTEYYLHFVSMQRLKNSQLSDCMLAIVVRSKFREVEDSHKMSPHLEVIGFYRNCMDDRSRLPYKNAIPTEFNLSSAAFLEILMTVGIDSSPYSGKFHLLDRSLLAKRNHIAHGQQLDVDVGEYLFLHDEITTMFSTFRNDLENAAVLRHFERTA